MFPQPIIIQGGDLPPLHVYHAPMWLPPIVKGVDQVKEEAATAAEVTKKVTSMGAQSEEE